MNKKFLGKVKKYQGYATYLSGKLRSNRSDKVRGVLTVIRGKTMEVL